MEQQVRFLTTTDDVSLAWTLSGHGRPLVKASNWLTHLRHDRTSPVWRHWIDFFDSNFRYLRYDERGCGMSDWIVTDMSFPRWIEDLTAVIEAADLCDPFVLLGMSQGAATAAAYAARHPERVSHLILYGGYARGAKRRGDVEAEHLYEAMETLASIGWEKDNPVFRQIFTSRFIPDGTEEQIRWFNQLCRRTTTAAIGAQLLSARANVDASHLLGDITVPTLVLHAVSDEVVPLQEGRLLAREIPDATFVELESRNHILLEHEPAWRTFQEAVIEFVGASRCSPAVLEATLSARERHVLSLLCAGLTNAQIGWELGLAEKTVRNHISSIYRKLGVRSRTEAIVLVHADEPTPI